ncbi:hypothetical protein [Aliiglaciecola lipolytica]|uniref:hypothetical protein n=1 Tax=Aliiglaciecola lipolytica TaxID=477689 RepID=UPI001C08BABF|nr:hypothetical protein [Aliiglaciecola lipolytica]MBU2876691.1 hypothetical protein [Aliiglaciecola lipolytica]
MDIQINQVLRRYQLSASQRTYKARLDYLTEQLLREYVDLALLHSGYSQRDIICIRNWYLPIDFDNSKTDVEIFECWLIELESSLQKLFATADAKKWIHYRSKVEALKSVAIDLAAQQLSHVWAWHQMGIVSQSSLNLQEAKSQWLAYLIRQPTLLKAVLIGLAVEGRLEILIARRIIEFDDALKLIGGLLEFTPNWVSITAHINTHVEINWSGLVVTFRRYLASQSNRRIDEITLLPEWIKGYLSMQLNNGHSGIDLNKITKLNVDDIKCLLFSGVLSEWSGSGVRKVISNNQSLTAYVMQLVEEIKTVAGVVSTAFPFNHQHNQPNSLQATKQQNDNNFTVFRQTEPISVLSAEKVALLSSFAGILYVLNILKQPKWQQQLATLVDKPYPLIQQLNLLGQYLQPQGTFDPALNVFSGELMVFEPTQDDDCAISTEDKADYQIFAEKIKLAIYTSLAKPLNNNVSKTFDWLCQRNARIEYQAGWVNIVFEMDAIDTQIRTAGLDLNPDYVPWLGYVVKFYYE